MNEKKPLAYKSPDLSKMIEVKIDERTRIYILAGMDPKKARSRYLEKFSKML